MRSMAIAWTEQRNLQGHLSFLGAVDYGLKDEKGRKVGGLLIIRHTLLDSFLGNIQATRDGWKFGAITPHAEYPSLEEAKAALEKKAAQSMKRFQKKYGAPQQEVA